MCSDFLTTLRCRWSIIDDRHCLTLPSDEFKSLFQPFGNIEHAVILAVLDNFSRRRGFVVFSSHAQARTAMRATHKMTVKSVLYSRP